MRSCEDFWWFWGVVDCQVVLRYRREYRNGHRPPSRHHGEQSINHSPQHNIYNPSTNQSIGIKLQPRPNPPVTPILRIDPHLRRHNRILKIHRHNPRPITIPLKHRTVLIALHRRITRIPVLYREFVNPFVSAVALELERLDGGGGLTAVADELGAGVL